jgi:hypothetical protein
VGQAPAAGCGVAWGGLIRGREEGADVVEELPGPAQVPDELVVHVDRGHVAGREVAGGQRVLLDLTCDGRVGETAGEGGGIEAERGSVGDELRLGRLALAPFGDALGEEAVHVPRLAVTCGAVRGARGGGPAAVGAERGVDVDIAKPAFRRPAPQPRAGLRIEPAACGALEVAEDPDDDGSIGRPDRDAGVACPFGDGLADTHGADGRLASHGERRREHRCCGGSDDDEDRGRERTGAHAGVAPGIEVCGAGRCGEPRAARHSGSRITAAIVRRCTRR